MSSGTPPLVTVLVPARNEAADLARALAAIAAQDYPHEWMQVLVVDGNSIDRTVEIAEKVLSGASFFDAQVISNRSGATPSNLNRGLAAAAGRYLCRVDARSLIPKEYVRRCVETLADDSIVVVGGRQVAIPGGSGVEARAITRALNNRWTTGLSRYRRGVASGPSDTVYLGAFRTDQVRDVGGWDERLETNQDFDLNRRLSRSGTIWFDASLRVEYVARRRLVDLWRQYQRFGEWKVRYWRLTDETPLARQWLGLVGPWAAFAAVTAWVALGRRGRTRRGLAAGAAGLGALGALDALGTSDDEPASPDVRLVSGLAIGVVLGGWAWGAARAASDALGR